MQSVTICVYSGRTAGRMCATTPSVPYFLATPPALPVAIRRISR